MPSCIFQSILSCQHQCKPDLRIHIVLAGLYALVPDRRLHRIAAVLRDTAEIVTHFIRATAALGQPQKIFFRLVDMVRLQMQQPERERYIFIPRVLLRKNFKLLYRIIITPDIGQQSRIGKA